MLEQRKWFKFFINSFIILLLILGSLVFFNSPGTGDTRFWREWAINADTLGLVSGYKANKDMYPPFASVILLASLKASQLLGFTMEGAIKLSILLFLFCTSLAFWTWTRNLSKTVILHFSLLLCSVALKYIDIFFAPFLIVSLWALKERKLVLFSVFFSITCLIKWQPLIITPFIALYLLDIKQLAQWKQIEWKKLCLRVVLPVIMMLGFIFLIYGSEVWNAFHSAMKDGYLSGNALNFNWILTHFLHVYNPGKFGGLIDGQSDLITTTSLDITLIPRLLFLATFIITFVSFFKRDKTFENLILFSLVGYFAYFTFNISVHENHLFITTILSVVLFWLNRKHLSTMFILVLMFNINLFVFYGIDGFGLTYNRVLHKRIDIALLLSIFNVSYFLFLWVTTTLISNKTHSTKKTNTNSLPFSTG